MKRAIVASLLLIGLLTSGCVTRILDFTVISSKNVDWSHANTFERARNRAQGEDVASIIIFIPTGIPNAKEALDRAIESVPGAVALVDGVLYNKAFYIPMLYGEQSFIVEGTPLIDKQLAAASTPHGGYYVTRIGADGMVQETKTVSKAEYAMLREKYNLTK